MKIRMAAFSNKGRMLMDKLQQNMTGYEYLIREEEDLVEWAGAAFREKDALLFIGASGIAVRSIAPWVKDKLTDSPVLVMDELGSYVIPILSGHMGGANSLAYEIARSMGAVPVITTATDVEKTFAVDVFARKNNLLIADRNGIQKVSSKLLKEGKATIAIAPCVKYKKDEIPASLELVSYPPESSVDILIDDELEYEATLQLIPKRMILGIGCKKGKAFEELEEFVTGLVDEEFIDEAYGVASIDLKKDEEGLVTFAKKHNLPFMTYSAEVLLQVEGDFTDSEFVKKTTGVANVCERSALFAAGEGGKLIMRKQSYNGMTFALAMRNVEITTWEMDYE